LWTNWPDISRHAFVRLRQEMLERDCDAAVRDLMKSDAERAAGGAKVKKKRRVKA
jgi:hypothetical protein